MPSRFYGGRNRTRTCDPIDVNDVLYHIAGCTFTAKPLFSFGGHSKVGTLVLSS